MTVSAEQARRALEGFSITLQAGQKFEWIVHGFQDDNCKQCGGPFGRRYQCQYCGSGKGASK